MTNRFLFTLLLPLSFPVFGATSGAFSLPDSVAKELDEVNVVAIKSGPKIQDQPVASTVIGIAAIERNDILTMKSASDMVPNLYIPDYGTRMTSSIYMRGLGARIDQPVMGLNVDNVAFLNKDNFDFDIPDIARVEVLRGPQSTLYGRNTMGGVINVNTLSPMEWQGVRAMATFGYPFQAKAAAGVYGKLAPRLAMSFSAYFTHSDGDWHNEYNNSRIGTENAASFRWKTVWCPRPAITLENTAAVQLNKQNGYPYAYAETGKIAYNDTCFYRRTGVTDGLTATWRPSSKFSISSISSVQYIDDNMTLDNDFLPDSYFVLTQKRSEWALTQDFIARGAVGGRAKYQWLAGLFGFYRSSSTDAPVTFLEDGIEELIIGKRNQFNPQYPAYWDTPTFNLSSYFFAPQRGIAAYHKSTLSIGNFVVAAGLRLDYEHPSLSYRSVCNTSYTTWNMTNPAHPSIYNRTYVDIDDSGHLSMSFLQLLPCFEGLWKFPKGMGNVYFNIAKGYKAGGYNTQMFSDVLQQKMMGYMGFSKTYDTGDIISYQPEWSWNYEIGAHLDITDWNLRGEIALFYIDCHDQQLTVFPDGNTTGRMMTNAGRTRSVGGELSVVWRPVKPLEFHATYGYTDARFTNFFNGIEDYTGKRLPYAPSNTLWVSGSYNLPLRSVPENSIEFNLNMRGVGDIYWDEANTMRQPFYIVPGFSAIYHHPVFDAELWVTNFTATRHDVFSFISIGHQFVQRGYGCRAGVTLRLNLDGIL